MKATRKKWYNSWEPSKGPFGDKWCKLSLVDSVEDMVTKINAVGKKKCEKDERFVVQEMSSAWMGGF